MAKQKTESDKIAEMSVAARIEIAKKLTDRVTDHLLYLLELHETNRIVVYSPILASQIPTSHAANAFSTFQRGLHQFEIVRLCALWDGVDQQKENIPTVIELIDHPDVLTALAEETASHWKNRPVGHISGLPSEPQERSLILESVRRHQDHFGDEQAARARRDLEAAIAETRAMLASPKHASVMNLRDKHLAHSLVQSRREIKAGPLDPMKYGDEREMLEASLRIATALMSWVKGASFDFEESRRIDRANAEALWTQCTFDIKW